MSQSWQDKTPTPLHILHPTLPIRRIAWRPGHDTELVTIPSNQPLASGNSPLDPSVHSITSGLGNHPSLLDDNAHLEIWDVRRHHVAKYNLPTADGMAVDAIWSDEGSLVTTFQNGVFAQLDIHHQIKGADVPLDSIPRQVMAWNVRGEMAFAVDRFKQGEIPFDDMYVLVVPVYVEGLS